MLRNYLKLTLSALFAPWTTGVSASQVSDRAARGIAIFHVAIAAALSALLSSWTYLAGKGLMLGGTEMDLGQDDLPADTIRQVAAGMIGSFAAWAAILALALVLCAAVADAVYRRDRAAFRAAVRSAFGATAWFVVWALIVLVANGMRHGGVRHPARAIRAYAQLRQQGFDGSSAIAPGPPERERLVGRGRLSALAVVFPVLWAVGLTRSRNPRSRMPRLIVVASAIVFSWIGWAAVWRLIPWTSVEALLG